MYRIHISRCKNVPRNIINTLLYTVTVSVEGVVNINRVTYLVDRKIGNGEQ